MKKSFPNKKHLFFRQQLLRWKINHPRPLPWKEDKNPYYIWLSEIILQQTRVEQGLPYFLKFKTTFPRIQDLAKASEDEVFKMWQGLGYYTRARNLHATAKLISSKWNGQFPNTYEDILALPGVGPYTAAAIASFAYQLPKVVVDGNVIRVISRFYGIDLPVDKAEGKNQIQVLAEQTLDKEQPDVFNQAIMDFGALHCKPKNPLCTSCFHQKECIAFQNGNPTNYPVKSRRLKKKTRFFNYLVIRYKDQVGLQKRTKKDIWQNLYEFPVIESTKPLDATTIKENPFWINHLVSNQAELIACSKGYKQTLSHQNIIAHFFEIEIKKPFDENNTPFFVVEQKKLPKFAIPKIIDCFLKDKSLYLF